MCSVLTTKGWVTPLLQPLVGACVGRLSPSLGLQHRMHQHGISIRKKVQQIIAKTPQIHLFVLFYAHKSQYIEILLPSGAI